LATLVVHFGHNEDTASAALIRLLSEHGKVYDDDTIHHESSFRVAAAAHYFSTPPELLAYRRNEFFKR
jgi:hypothetical protein